MKKYVFVIFFSLFLFISGNAFAHAPDLVYLRAGDVQINNPEISQAFYDELKGQLKNYFINSDKSFELYINLLVPEAENPNGKYSAKIFQGEEQIFELDGNSAEWKEYYENFGRDYYLRGPELDKRLPAGNYKIEVYSKDNLGKYVLVIGKKEIFTWQNILNTFWQLPLLKLQFFKTDVLQFFLTPFGIAGVGAIGGLLIFIAIIYWLVGAIKTFIKHNQAKTLLLTSAGMQMKNEIIKLLQKPAYDITVAFISTAHKIRKEQDPDYSNEDLHIMRDEMGFNVQEVDIDGKKESEVMELLKLKDIIFVAGGNTFYLLNAMRKCNFERVIRKLLKEGKVYIGASAGSIVAGKTIKTAAGFDENLVRLKNLKGLNLVPFDIFVHYQPEHAELIKQKIKSDRKRKKLKILTDEQAILVQGREVSLIGEGEAIVI
ncbi:MAG: hypothetical protein A2358_00535 [Candidatus Staskawiczbacteria bacterium RIFOXYB1_FULL_37_44]|uniref:Peptidase S51 dipeptidase E n=1 Tax=Candidatus Staskawiczbacteria bacterium RIFOXYB1_FULL_37_44 TaxID=1802223 RepID=A0A1G2IX53_9BACT|nr:MAG: hypothetical protein A2358_00535 [Candidatus Staskawiczbacteria bacterium RIFOXYB1_FULL_37_44]OGZ83498.1 MAG: hypothetical protein A2416_04200 [Candidatus Staskawiczbacteria bacterium RIFOXYC1_FULL_37_52]OGZ87932.1 MAG: hypothetical protein A2444_02185 [Candidatus Staskawiczbacteria bacterium RIFOXYC2_FULL_37_19]OGZ90164.1 MAG: hypothetical protein A2581_02000 [Candidatus Staskawiczbacteria bacterium RIFOXYD1_FULL_37_110]